VETPAVKPQQQKPQQPPQQPQASDTFRRQQPKQQPPQQQLASDTFRRPQQTKRAKQADAPNKAQENQAQKTPKSMQKPNPEDVWKP